jgi:hypothetical protein
MEIVAATAAMAVLLSNHGSYGNPPKHKRRQVYDFSGPWFDRPLSDEDDWWEQTLNRDNWIARSHDLDPTLWDTQRGQRLNRIHNRAYVSSPYLF